MLLCYHSNEVLVEMSYFFGFLSVNSFFFKFTLDIIKNAVFFCNNIHVASNLSFLIFKEGNLVCQSKDIKMPVVSDKSNFALLLSEVDDILKQFLIFNHNIFVDE